VDSLRKIPEFLHEGNILQKTTDAKLGWLGAAPVPPALTEGCLRATCRLIYHDGFERIRKDEKYPEETGEDIFFNPTLLLWTTRNSLPKVLKILD
jgi:hypothetical protein